MPSTYSANLRLELQATGENSNTWGTKTNNNLNLIGDAISGYLAVALVDGTNVLTANDGTADQTRQASLEFTGTLSSAATAQVVGGVEGRWIVRNSCTGGTVTFRVSGGTGVTLPSGESILVYSDGVSVWSVTPALTSVSSTYIYANKIVTPELSATTVNASVGTFSVATVSAFAAVSVSAAALFAPAGTITSFAATTVATSALTATSATVSAITATSVSAAAGSFTTLTVGGSQFSQSGLAKAWANFDGTTGTIRSSYNVSAVTRTAVGRYTVKFITPFTSASYIMTGSAFTEGDDSQGVQPASATAFTVSTADIAAINNGGTGVGGLLFDAPLACVVFYGA